MTKREKGRKLCQLRKKLNETYLKIRETSPDTVAVLLQEARLLGNTELIYFAEIQLVFIRYDVVSSDVVKELEDWVTRVEEYEFKKLSFLIRIRLANRVFVFNTASEYIQLAYTLLKELYFLKFPKEFDLQCRSILLLNIGHSISAYLPLHYVMVLKKVLRLNFRKDVAIYDMTKIRIANVYFKNDMFVKSLEVSLPIFNNINRYLSNGERNQSFTLSLLSSLRLKKYDVSTELMDDFNENYISMSSSSLLSGVNYAVIKFYIDTHQLDLARKHLNNYRRRLQRNPELQTQFTIYLNLKSELFAAEGSYRMALKLNTRAQHDLSLFFRNYQVVKASDLRSIVDLFLGESLPDYYIRQSRRKRGVEIKLWLSLNQKLYHHFVLNGLNDLQSSVYLSSQADQLALATKFRMLFDAVSLSSGIMWHSLQDEINLVMGYRDLMGFKYGVSPDFHIDVPDELLSVGCPYFLLQGVMENAFKHGYNSGQHQFSMKLNARSDGNTLHLTFTDNGKGVQQPSSTKSGMIGLSANRQRMEMLSAWTGLPAGIEVVFAPAGQTFGTSVLMQLPRLTTPCRVADYHLALCKKDQQKFSRSRAAVS